MASNDCLPYKKFVLTYFLVVSGLTVVVSIVVTVVSGAIVVVSMVVVVEVVVSP